MDKLIRIIAHSIESKVTDIHISEYEYVRIRSQGKLNTINEIFSKDEIENLVKYLLNEDQFSVLENKRAIDFSKQLDDLGNFRFNIYYFNSKLALSIRVLPLKIPTLEELGYPSIIKDTIKDRMGLVLISGPTGSGKSTLIASLINEINKNEQKHIITIEDPIEYRYVSEKSLIHQREVNQDVNDYHQGLVQALRQDPDVIVLQEMRDAETMFTVLNAAETGHLVFATVHTNGAAMTIDRIVDAFPGDKRDYIAYLLASVLNYVVSLQLVPRSDGTGLVGVAEFLKINNTMQNLIRERKTFQIDSFMATQQLDGMITLEAYLANLVNKDIIKYEEALRRCRNINLFNSYIKMKKTLG